MSSIQALREFINERLTAAAGEIFTVFEEAIMHYEEEIERQRSRLLEINWTPPIKLKGTENPQQHTGNQKMISSLEQEEHEAPRIKEEQEDYVAVTVTDGESDNPHNSVRDLTIQRLTAAAVEIFTMYEQTAVQCEEEIDRQRRLLEINWNPQNELHRTAATMTTTCPATPPRPWTTLEDPAFRHLQDLADKLGASPRSSLMSEEKYNSIIQHLRRPQEKIDPQFKHWVKKRKFQIMDLPGLGLSQVLVLPNDNKNKNDSDSPYLCVLHSGNVVHIVHDIHTHELNHSGYKKVLDYAQRQYFGVFRGLVQEYCNSCQTCQLKQLQAVRPPLWAILQEDFLDHMQSPPVPSPTTHTSIRKRTLDGSHQAATQTADSDNQCKREKVQESEAGDTVSVGVPRLERSSLDLTRLPGIDRDVIKTDALITQHGTLQGTDQGGDLQEYVASSDPVVTPHEAACKSHPESKFTKTSSSNMKDACEAGDPECHPHTQPHSHQAPTCSHQAGESHSVSNQTMTSSQTPDSHVTATQTTV